jgi:predicted RNA-binding protein YlxR (DUF448 family)
MLARVDEEKLDDGPKGAGGERFCAVTREAKPVDEMMRFVLGPDGRVVADLKRRLPGRGLWVTATKNAIAQAVRRNIFAKGFKADVRVPADFAETTEQQLERFALDALSIANKAGRVVFGFAKVEITVAREELAALLRAREAAHDGIRKLDAALHRRFGADKGEIVVVDAFSVEQLDLALGRSNVVHAALLAGPASEAFLARYSRLARFRTGETGGLEHDKARPEKPQGLESE